MAAPTIHPPTARDPRPVTEERALTGKRVIVAIEDPDTGIVQHAADYRAASEVFTEGGRQWVRVVPEAVWYAWVADTSPGKTPACPRAVAALAVSVWCE